MNYLLINSPNQYNFPKGVDFIRKSYSNAQPRQY